MGVTAGEEVFGPTTAPLLLPAVSLSYGGLTLRFTGEEPEVRFPLRAPHLNFRVDDRSAAHCHVSCRLGSARPLPGPPIFDADGVWELRRSDGGVEETCFFTTEGATRLPILRLRMEPTFDRGRLTMGVLGGGRRPIPLTFPIDEYLVARLLARSGGVVLHACCLLSDGGAYVFMGHSGAGKSTVSELAEGAGVAEVLSDDRTILRPRGGVVEAWGTPWHGSYSRGSPRSAPVRGLFLLVQSREDVVRPLSGAEAFSEAFVRLIQPSVATEELSAGLDALEAIVRVVPTAALHFRPTVEAFLLARAFADAPDRAPATRRARDP